MSPSQDQGRLKVLFLCPWLPWPLNSGGKIRTFNLIQSAGEWADIHLRAVLEPEQGQAEVDALAPHVASLKVFGRERPGAVMRFTRSKMERWFHSPKLADAVREELETERYDVVHIDELLHSRILPMVNRAASQFDHSPPVVQHHHKLDTNFAKSINTNRGLQKHFDSWKLNRLERKAANQHTHHLLCSDDDAAMLGGRYPSVSTSVVPSGYDPAYFTKGKDRTDRDPQHIVFVGSMDYGPNSGAVTRFVGRVMPLLLARRPSLHFSIVGRNPAPEILALASPNITVTGDVPDVRPYLAKASLMVVPLLIGGGTRLKIVEAMGMDCPVVSSTIGAEGLGLTHDQELLLADDSEPFAEAILALLDDPKRAERLANKARKYVEANLTWKRLAQNLVGVWRKVSQA
ncbi:MAG: glycosyltransferase [Planctomycetota bacterium]|nr:glycosyltransferase [Planctomycetota bacterium]